MFARPLAVVAVVLAVLSPGRAEADLIAFQFNGRFTAPDVLAPYLGASGPLSFTLAWDTDATRFDIGGTEAFYGVSPWPFVADIGGQPLTAGAGALHGYSTNLFYEHYRGGFIVSPERFGTDGEWAAYGIQITFGLDPDLYWTHLPAALPSDVSTSVRIYFSQFQDTPFGPEAVGPSAVLAAQTSSAVPVPEPSTLVSVLLGIAVCAGLRRRAGKVASSSDSRTPRACKDLAHR